MNNIALGRYIPLNSPIHKLDPRIKIMSMIFLMASIFIVNSFPGHAFMYVILIATILASKLTFKFILKSMKPMMFMLIFLSILNIFAIKQGHVILTLGSFKVYDQAIFSTLFVVSRLVLMIMVTTLLTATTPPLDLTLGIEDLLKPFVKIGVPAHEIAMMISIALRFIPTLIEDTQKIMNAQASRGVDLDEGKIIEKINGVVSMIIPLFVTSYHRAEDLADAMEARGYYPGKTRTRYKQLSIKGKDIAMLVFTIIVLVIAIAIRVL